MSDQRETQQTPLTDVNLSVPHTSTNRNDPTPAFSDQGELAQVREIILGPDAVQQRLRKPEVDRLREIIFAPQMQEYEQRFTDLQREMERVLAELRQMQDRIREFEKAQTKQVEALEREMHRANNELRREVARARAQEPMLQQLLTQVRQQEILGQDLSGSGDQLRKNLVRQERDLQALASTVAEHRDQREHRLDALKNDIRQAENNLRDELRHIAERLNDQKTDRRVLASMLMGIATRLETGTNVTNLLEGIAAPSEE